MRITSVFLLSINLLLCGCNPFINYGTKPSTAWQAYDLDSFLKQNYPIGSDEKKLVADFTAHEYKLESNCLAPSVACEKYLSTPSYCDWAKGSQEGFSIRWLSDAHGKITTIQTNKTHCLLTP